MSSGLEIVHLLRTARNIYRFLKVSYGIYQDDPHWVAPILLDVKKVFTEKNPLFEHAEMELWIARRDGQDVGRIMGLIDEHRYRKLDEQVAFFGFFESVNDTRVSRELFAAVRKWAQQNGMKQLLGPMNPTTNDECGLLIEGFDSSPVFMMTYNPRYYVELIETEGFRKAKDLLAFHIDLATLPMDRLHRIAEQVKNRNGQVSFRPILRRTLQRDLAKVKEIYNAAWQDNWGFVPMTEAEVDFLAARLKPLLVQGLMWIAERGTEPVGFLLALPDYNITFKPMLGRLLTPKALACIPYLLGWKRHAATRVLTLGVKEAYRQKGLESALLIEGLRVGFNNGVRESEASWILEDNVMMCRMLETIGGRVYKKYRIYEREV
jgi:hypothetical protein